ncbi:glutamate synthase central domain-containing protein, partial [Sphingomonas sp. RB3P16]|uniref:glutamate synthase central domain-containing protein n=1 Tax=Parasphingomonas frigoris TaxID=3096163 RepID=UPI002FC5FAB4
AYGTATGVSQALDRMRGHGDTSDTALVDMVRSGARGHDGRWPTLAIWHGGADATVSVANADTIARQWRGIHGVDAKAVRAERVGTAVHRIWSDTEGRDVVEDWTVPGMGHGTPIDPLRERHVMSLKTRFGNLANILDVRDQRERVLVLDSPVLTGEHWSRLKAHFGNAVAEIDCTFDVGGGPEKLRAAIQRIRNEAEQAVRQGKSEIFLTDEAISEDRVGIAGVLAVAAVHTHLVRRGLRSYASINVRTAECLDTHYYAVLIGVGATTVNAYLAEAAIVDRQSRGLFGDLELAECLRRHRVAVEEGLLKIMSKMGIAVISSYRGGYNFEAVGLSRSLVNDLFPGMPAKISGEGYASLHVNATDRHEAAFDPAVATLPIGGFYRQRHTGETHAYSAQLMHLLQTAVATDSYT